MKIRNIYSDAKIPTSEEFFEDIIRTNSFRIEKIISEGHVTPEGYWYDQEDEEFVLLLKGEAKIEFKSEGVIEMKEGDYITIPKHKLHRVVYTSKEEKTFWLTVFYKD